jgi:hypothetical protein
VRVDLSVVLYSSSGELERVNSPSEVSVPICASEWKTFTNSRFIDLNSEDLSLFKVNNLISESESELLGLNLS